MQGEQPPVDSVWTMYTPPFGRTNSHQLLPQTPRTSESRPSIWKNFPQVMSSPQPQGMNKYRTNHVHQNNPERRTE
jgi:hypothetical protein